MELPTQGTIMSYSEQPPPPVFETEVKEVTSKSPSAGKNSALEQGRNTPAGWKPTVAQPLPPVRCTGTVRNGPREGERCGKWSLEGHDKCLVHGGNLPNVREAAAKKVEAAKLRLLGESDAAIDTLMELIEPGTAAQVRLGAAKEILDRAGIKGGADLTVEVQQIVSYKDEVATRLKEIRERKAAMEAKKNEIIEDAEIVEEGTDG